MTRAISLTLLMLLAATSSYAAEPAAASQAAPQAAAPQAGAKKPAQQSTAGGLGFGKHDSNAPINVSSENFVGDLATKIGTYIGNVLVIQGDMRMRADKVKVNVTQGKPTRIEADGHVVVNAPNGTATGDNGVYDLGPRTITMTGHVVLTKEKDVMRGTRLVMDMNTNLAHLTAQGMQGNRVQGLFIPPPQQNANGTAAGTQKPAQGAKTSDQAKKPEQATTP
jgi:lipopolysaccharide export system protein LptA